MREKNHEIYEQYVQYTDGKESNYQPDHSHPQCNFMRVLEGFTIVIDHSQKSETTTPAHSSQGGSREHSPMQHDGTSSSSGGSCTSHLHIDSPASTSSSSHGHVVLPRTNGVNGGVHAIVNDVHTAYAMNNMQDEMMMAPPQQQSMPDHMYSQYANTNGHATGYPTSNGVQHDGQGLQLQYAPQDYGSNIATYAPTVQPFVQGAADLTLDLPLESDQVGWSRIFEGFGGRLGGAPFQI